MPKSFLDKELSGVAILGDIGVLMFDAKSGRLYAISGGGAVAVIEKVGDKSEMVSKVETPKSARTAPLAADGDRLVVAVLVQGGVGGLEVRVFAVRPPTPKS